MKIKNDVVSLKIGDKQYDFNNLILDEYLKRFVKSQLNQAEINNLKYSKKLEYCLLKFDTPLKDVSNSSIIYNQEFDIVLMWEQQKQQVINEDQIIVEYFYNSRNVIDYSDDKPKDISSFYGRKITAIGFNVWFNKKVEGNESTNLPVLAVLDTSNYNIYLQKDQHLNITRRDIITTDTLFYSNDNGKLPGPLHLAPYGKIIENNKHMYGILYSVGLSSYIDYIDKEFAIGQDIQVEQNGNELNIKDIENYLSLDNPLFCSNELYCSTSLYPVKTNYKYLILKYKVWQEVHSGTIDTGYYYYQAIPINKFGKINLKIKYERS